MLPARIENYRVERGASNVLVYPAINSVVLPEQTWPSVEGNKFYEFVMTSILYLTNYQLFSTKAMK